MKNVIWSLWSEPAAEDPPPVAHRDWMLGAAVVIVVVFEVAFRSDVIWRPVVAVFGLGLAVAAVFRRSLPLACVVFGLVGFALLDVATTLMGSDPIVLYAGSVVLVLVYSLFRWGSGRHAVTGLLVMQASTAVIIAANFTGVADAIGGPVVLLFAAALGGAVRYRTFAQAELVGRAKLQEREQLARELHDTVAHHVSAIAIQAQAGLFMARSSSLEGATEALEIIDSEAERTLDEMRMMVSVLRDRDITPDLQPRRGLADIERLALSSAGDTRIDVQLVGDLTNLPSAHEVTLYRVSQESVTNALRHAQQATLVNVKLVGSPRELTLTIDDNGARTTARSIQPGFGLAGMTERVALLDGTLAAGPNPDSGWLVHAVLPRPQVTT